MGHTSQQARPLAPSRLFKPEDRIIAGLAIFSPMFLILKLRLTLLLTHVFCPSLIPTSAWTSDQDSAHQLCMSLLHIINLFLLLNLIWCLLIQLLLDPAYESTVLITELGIFTVYHQWYPYPVAAVFWGGGGKQTPPLGG